jgi:sulfite reductase beta subunit-like hemoprotein
VAFVIPPLNDLDVLTNDLGLIAIVEGDRVVGYNLAVGGGMGRSHGNEADLSALADVLGFFTRAKLVDIAKAVLTVHRDFGDRTDRKHARLKYVVQERGADWTRPAGRGAARESGWSQREPLNSPSKATSTAGTGRWTADGSWDCGYKAVASRTRRNRG